MSWRRSKTAQERLDEAERLLRDGASQREVSFMTGISRGVLGKHFPDLKWTFKEAGEFRAATRYVKATI